MNRKQIRILFLVFFLSSSITFSQVNKNKVLLSSLLNTLQKKYSFKFTYADDVVQNIYVDIPKENLSFKQVINKLRKETKLVFRFLDHKFITISNNYQWVCGYIIDKEKGIPIPRVAVVGKNNSCITDELGYFKLKVSLSNRSLKISHIGYNAIALPIEIFKNNDCANIYLNPMIEELSEIVLTHYLTKGIEKVEGGMLKIKLSNFGILPGLIETDVLQTIQSLPGIQSLNETVSDINIRGGTNDENLILWDGIKMYQSGHFFGLISAFNPLIISDATIIKNGTSVAYSDGVSGSILLKTGRHLNQSFSGSIGGNFISIDGFTDIPITDKSSLQIAARSAISDVIETPTYTKYFDRISQDSELRNNNTTVVNSDKNFSFFDTSLRWLYNISDKDELRLNFISINNELEFIESATINQQKLSKESSIVQNSIAGGIFYKRIWSSKFSTDVQVYETDYTLKAINAEVTNQQRLLQENVVSETSIKFNTWFKFNDDLSFLNGYQFVETGIKDLTDVDNPVYRNLARKVLKEHALYSQINYLSSSQKTIAKVGFRYNYIQEFNEHLFEPRVSINHKLFTKLSLELLGEFKHQNTSQIINFQNDFLGIEKRRWQLSNNTSIPIIKSKQVSIGLNYQYKNWLLTTDAYIKEVNGITSQSQGFLNQYQTQKASGSYTVKGVDFLMNKKIHKFSSWVSYSFSKNTYTFNDFAEVNFPNNLEVTHTLGLGTSFATEKLKISAGLNWHSGKPTTTIVSNHPINNGNINFEKANTTHLNDYFRIDISAMYNFNPTQKTKATFGVSIWNISNHKNVINHFYKLNDTTVEEIFQNALGLTPNITFRWYF